MRILQIHNRYRLRGGEDTVVEQEAELLRAAGHQVAQLQVENPEEAIPAARALMRAPWNGAAARRAAEAAASARPDLAHVHNTWFSLSPAIFPALQESGLPVVATLHNYRVACVNALLLRDGRPCELCVGSHPWHGVRHRCYRGSAVASAIAATTIATAGARRVWERSVSAIVALTDFARRIYVQAGIPEERISVKPNFVPDPGARPIPPSGSDTVLFVGRLCSEKGIGVLLEAWERWAPPDLRLLVLGDGPLRPELEGRRLRGVELAGAVPSELVRREMLRARLLAFPSQWYEGQPMVLLEALAAGLPVLAPRLGPMPEILGEEAAAVEQVADPEAWSHAMAVAADGLLADRLGAGSRERYEARHTPARATADLEALYGAVLGA